MRLEVVRKSSIEELRSAGIENPRTCVDWLIEHVVGLSRVEVLSDPRRLISTEQHLAIADGVARRIVGEPIQYIVGWTEFFGLRLRVSPAVLIPRPETEGVVEAVLDLSRSWPGCRILDVGTGSGCIALAVASRQHGARLVGCDVSTDALEVAIENATLLGLRLKFVEADVEKPQSLDACGPEFDLMVSNPPYIPDSELGSLPPELQYEPSIALFAGDDPLRFYRALADCASDRLVTGGWLVTELHATYAEDVVSLTDKLGFCDVQVRQDLAGHPRVLLARWDGGPAEACISPD